MTLCVVKYGGQKFYATWHMRQRDVNAMASWPTLDTREIVLLHLWHAIKPLTYCGWKKSCTTLDGWNPINNGINHLSTGAGFLPSTVGLTQMFPKMAIPGCPDVQSPTWKPQIDTAVPSGFTEIRYVLKSPGRGSKTRNKQPFPLDPLVMTNIAMG